MSAASPVPWAARVYRRRRTRDRRRRLADRARVLAARRSFLHSIAGWSAYSGHHRYLLDYRHDYPLDYLRDSSRVYLRDYPLDSPPDYSPGYPPPARDDEPLPGVRAGAWLAAAALLALVLVFARAVRRRAATRRRQSGEWAEPPPAYADVCAERPDKGPTGPVLSEGPAPSAGPPDGLEATPDLGPAPTRFEGASAVDRGGSAAMLV